MIYQSRIHESIGIMYDFRARQSSDSNYVRVTGQNTGCWSSVGKRGGQQSLNLQPSGCMSSSTIQHEFIHALGMYHMQSRPDRDQYVTIHFDNIQAGKEHNFQLLSDTLTFNTEYNAEVSCTILPGDLPLIPPSQQFLLR